VALRVSGFVLDYLFALPLGCAIALLWANTLPDSYFRVANATAFFVNDIGIVFFFALITKEVAEATIPEGPAPVASRGATVAAAFGGVVVSIGSISRLLTGRVSTCSSGWVAACAIDIPGTYVIARLIFGKHPAVPFLLLLAISADAMGLAILAVSQSLGDVHPVVGLGLMARHWLGCRLASRWRQNFWLYCSAPACCPGGPSFWAASTRARLVPIVPFFPADTIGA
jgi:NhaA family Na+:H+ antiporter